RQPLEEMLVFILIILVAGNGHVVALLPVIIHLGDAHVGPAAPHLRRWERHPITVIEQLGGWFRPIPNIECPFLHWFPHRSTSLVKMQGRALQNMNYADGAGVWY